MRHPKPSLPSIDTLNARGTSNLDSRIVQRGIFRHYVLTYPNSKSLFADFGNLDAVRKERAKLGAKSTQNSTADAHSQHVVQIKFMLPYITALLRAHKVFELITPLALLEFRYQRVESRSRTGARELAQSCYSTERAPLKLSCAFQVLLNSILPDRWTFHASLEQRRNLAQALRDRSRGKGCQTEENHVTNHFYLV